MRASAIAETFLDGNLSTARHAVLTDPRPDLMALDVLTDLLDRELKSDVGDYSYANDIVDRWRRCLAGGL